MSRYKSSCREALNEDGYGYKVYNPEDDASDAEEAIGAYSTQLNVIMCLLDAPRDEIGVGLVCSILTSNIMIKAIK